LVAGLPAGVILGLSLAKASQAVLDSTNENPQYPPDEMTTPDLTDAYNPVYAITEPVPTLDTVYVYDAAMDHPLPPQDAVLQYNLQ